MPRFMIELDATSYEALCDCAEAERRDPPRQAEWMLWQALQHRLKHQVALRHLDAPHEAPAETEGEP